jgi:hypothetical protein
MFHLVGPLGHVIDHAVAADMGESIVLVDIEAIAPDDDAELDFPVPFLRIAWKTNRIIGAGGNAPFMKIVGSVGTSRPTSAAWSV